MLDYYFVFNIFNILVCIFNTFLLILLSLKFIQAYQFCGYKIKTYKLWLKQTKLSFVLCNLFLCLISFFLMFLVNFLINLYNLSVYFTYVSMCIYLVLSFIFFKIMHTQKFKVEFVYTSRIKRFIFFYMLICASVTTLTLFLNNYVNICFKFVPTALIPSFLFIFVIITHFLTTPIENIIKLKYIIKCKIKLKKYKKLKVIAITGSSGKTSTKFILEKMLEKKYKVLSTPHSYNTPMGLTKTVNNNSLKDIDYFIAEYGADRVNDIKKLCKIVKPDYSYITNIGNQHLKTFKTLQNLAKTKCQIFTYLKRDGTAFFNLDDLNVQQFAKTYTKKHINISNNENSILKISNVNVSSLGSTFTLSDGVESIDCKTCLLGEHNIQNIFACACIAYYLKISLKEIAESIFDLQPTQHRLQLISSNPSLTVLDDTFNSNQEGFKQALNVLSKFEGLKAIVTPGIVELGHLQEKVNFDMGVIIANICSVAIIVNKTNKDALYSGLVSAGFNKNNIFFFNTLNEAQQNFSSLLKNISVVLLENDLPDSYI